MLPFYVGVNLYLSRAQLREVHPGESEACPARDSPLYLGKGGRPEGSGGYVEVRCHMPEGGHGGSPLRFLCLCKGEACLALTGTKFCAPTNSRHLK